jgi:hypothetical protein
MAEVRLVDVYVPTPFNQGIQEAQIQSNAFLQSGVMAVDARISAMATIGGKVGIMPEFKPLGYSEPTYSTDDPSNVLVAKKIDSQSMQYRLASRNEAWSIMDLAQDLALGPQKAVDAITNRIGGYWAFDEQSRIINTMIGVIADNIANDSSDMVNDIGTYGTGAPVAAELAGAAAIIDAQQTIGDRQQTSFSAIGMHSVVYSGLRKQGLIETIRDADNNTLFETYGTMRVIVSDEMPAIAGANNRVKYHTYMFGAALIGAGNGNLSNPTETDRSPLAGNGSGQDTIISRQSTVLHPFGFSWSDTAVAGDFPTYAELRDATNWDRVRQRKNIPFAALITNG